MNKSTIFHTIPAASELHKVPGFNPIEYLHKSTNDKGESVMRMEPRYQRLWFRLACPKGRMLLNPLRITDQLAIFEAKVFFHKDDTDPASTFTSRKTVQETRNYIRAAQDEAMTIALDNAGFGIQLCDMTQPSSDGECPPPAQATGEKKPLAQSHVQVEPAPMQEAPPAATVHKAAAPENTPAAQPKKTETPPAETVKAAAAEPAPEPAPTVQPAAASQPAATVAPTSAAQPVPAHNPPPAPAAENLPAQVERQEPMDADKHEKSAESDGQQTAEVTVLNFPTQTEETAAPAGEAPNQPETTPQAAPSYTDDMSVEEICKVMTLEEAGAIVVPRGPNTGLTMAQVAERRPSSLRFFITQFYECSNIQKAAATLLLQNLEQKKAG
jgi:hypothetical protein